MGTPARFYRPLANRLGQAGLAVVVVDLRGVGSSTPPPSRASRYGYADLAGDVGAVLDALKPRLDGRRRYLLGHSLGGQTCAIHLAGGQDASTG
jgi:predicted alpha/beta hydrolase